MTDTATPTKLKPSEIQVQEDFNPRTEIDKKKLDELAASIKSEGIIQPLIVAPGAEGKYQLIAGHRRYAAAKQLKLRELPVVVRSVNGNAKAIAVIENLQREDLNPIDEANGFKQVMEAEGIKSQKQLAERLGVSTSQVSDRLKLLKLIPEVQALFATGALPAAAGSLLEKAQRFDERFASCLAIVLAEDPDVDASRMGEYEQASQALTKAAALAVNGPKPEDGEQTQCAVKMVEGYIDFNTVKLKWPPEHKALRDELKGYAWFAQWSEADIAACRAYGCLFEHKCKAGDDSVTIVYAFDKSFVLDLLQKKFEVRQHELEKAKEERAAQAKARRGTTSVDDQLQREQEEREKRMEALKQENHALVAAILEKLPDLEPGLEQLKAICTLALAGADEDYGYYLLRYDPECAELVAAKGNDENQLACELVRRVVATKTAEEVLRLTTAALLSHVWHKTLHSKHGELLGVEDRNDWTPVWNPTNAFLELGNKLRLFEATGDEAIEIAQPEEIEEASIDPDAEALADDAGIDGGGSDLADGGSDDDRGLSD